MDDLLDEAKALQANLYGNLARAVAREQEDVRSAVASRTSLPEHYWQERHKLACKVQAIDAIIEALHGR